MVDVFFDSLFSSGTLIKSASVETGFTNRNKYDEIKITMAPKKIVKFALILNTATLIYKRTPVAHAVLNVFTITSAYL